MNDTGRPTTSLSEGRQRIVLVSPLPPPLGGLTVWTEEFLRTAEILGPDISLVNISPGGDRVNAHSRIRVDRMRQMLGSMRELRRVLPGHEIAHLCTTWFYSLVREGVFARIARRAGVVPVLHVHASTEVAASVSGLSRVKTAILAWWLEPFAAIVVLTHDLREVLIASLPRQRVVVVPNGVDTDRFSPPASRDSSPGTASVSVLFVGRLSVDKGFCELAAAVAANPNVSLTTIGDRPDRGESAHSSAIDAALDALRATGRHTHFATVGREAIAEHYRSAEVFVLPSHREGMPVSLLEAMSSGLACVVTPVGAMGDIVSCAPESFAIVVDVGDAPGLTAALETLSADAALRLRMGTAARRLAVSGFSSAGSMAAMEALYADLTRPSDGTGRTG